MNRWLGLVGLLLFAGAVVASENGAPWMRNVSRPYVVSCGMEDRTIALWGSHGLYFNPNQQRWTWQRAHLWTTVEDLFTTSFVAPYLVPMLEHAGAVVVQPRAYVRPGFQSVYIRWAHSSKKRSSVTVHQGDCITQYEINPSVGAGVWHYLCTVDTLPCSVEGKGIEYMLIDEHTMGQSGRPRWMEAARYWVPAMGIPDNAWIRDTSYSDYLNDIVCRGGWVNYLCGKSAVNPKMDGLSIPVDVCLALHSDAGAKMNDSLIGSLAIYTDHDRSGCKNLPTGESRAINGKLAQMVLEQVTSDLQRTYTPLWPNRGVQNANYGETRDPKVPAIILELLAHQNYADMCWALNPAFRFTASRAIYKGLGRFLAARNHTIFIPQPLPPKSLHTFFNNDSLLLTWRPVVDSLEPTAQSSYYIVYTRKNSGSWDAGTMIHTPRYTCALDSGVQYDFYVAAGNEGGISMPSPIVSAFYANHHQPEILVVDAFQEVRGPHMIAFDSLTGGIVPGSRPIPDNYEMAYTGEQFNYNRKDAWISDDDCGFGMSSMQRAGQLLVGNTHDYSARHGRILRQLGISYVSCMGDAVEEADTTYRLVDIILGKSDTAVVHQMNQLIQKKHWTTNNHVVLLSGSFVGYPQQACASGTIQIWDQQKLSFSQELNTQRLSAENVSAVERLSATDVILARYTDTDLPAMVGGTNYILFGFPLETLLDFDSFYKQLIKIYY